jgi:hypothetical protein
LNEEEEPAASEGLKVEGLKVEGLKVVEKRKSRCGRPVSPTFDFKTLRLSDAAGYLESYSLRSPPVKALAVHFPLYPSSSPGNVGT